MDTPALSTDEFWFGRCERCAAEVLAHGTVQEDGECSLFCVRCDGPVATDLKVGDRDSLKAQGYEIYEESVGGCGSGGCGSGGCSR